MRNTDLQQIRSRRLYLNLKEIMSYDIRIHGERIILPEFTLATIVGITLTSIYLFYPSIQPLYRLQAIFWLGFALNCLTILLLSTILARRGLTKERDLTLTTDETAKLRRYTILIGVFLIIPYATLISGLTQWFTE